MDRKSIVILMAMFIPSFVIGQTDKAVKATTQKNSHHEIRVDSLLSRTDSLIMINNELLYRLDIDLSLKNRYKLYETENIYTLLRLDTKTGMIDQVQWSLDSDKEGTITINGEDLTYGFGVGSGSFELYPTKNMYQFILMDKTNGRMWHVQWGFEFKKRWIQRIY
jgi:outer membrane lipoprotein-sorting protein